MRKGIDVGNHNSRCASCRVDTPVRSLDALKLAWVSTMAFVAMGIIDKGDADNGTIYCPVCAERFIGPDWHAIGTWNANHHRARLQWECMMTGVTDGLAVH